MVSSTRVLPFKTTAIPAHDFSGRDNGAYVINNNNAKEIIFFLIVSVLLFDRQTLRRGDVTTPSHLSEGLL